jgi:hypothetical protein
MPRLFSSAASPGCISSKGNGGWSDMVEEEEEEEVREKESNRFDMKTTTVLCTYIQYY